MHHIFDQAELRRDGAGGEAAGAPFQGGNWLEWDAGKNVKQWNQFSNLFQGPVSGKARVLEV